MATARRAPILRRILAAIVAAAAVALATAAQAPARISVAHSSRGAATVCRTQQPAAATHRSSRRSSHCAKRHAHKHGTATHKHHKSAKKGGAPAVEIVPARCEDGEAPGPQDDGVYSCEDGSPPSCETGALVHVAANGAPMCVVPTGTSEAECMSDSTGECEAVMFGCEDEQESTEVEGGCSRAAGNEEEAPEPDEAVED